MRPFPIHPTYTGITAAYQNADMIADIVLPYTTPVGKALFNWYEYPIGQATTVPDTRIGRRSEANTIDVQAEERESKTVPHALSDLVPQGDIDDAPEGYDPRGHAAETVTDLMILKREVNVADKVFGADTYAPANRVDLAGGDQFDEETTDVFDMLWQARRKTLVKPNMMVLGETTWNQMATNPKLIAKLYGAASTRGVARKEDLASMLELKRGIVVGEARVNTANIGQPVALGGAWGPHAALLYINPLANNQRGLTFGMTVPRAVSGDAKSASGGRWRTREVPEPKIGIDGSTRIIVESERKELIVSADCGYFFENAVTPQ
ncbi:hypothetical protein D3C71_314530 [compost metagenome]